MKFLLSVLLLAKLAFSIYKSEEYEGCNGQRNDKKLLELDAELQSTTSNGKKWLMQEGNNKLIIANVTGTPYEMGFAYGTLLKNEINENFVNFEEYVKEQYEETLQNDMQVPQFLVKQLAAAGITLTKYLLQLNWELAEPFIPERYPEEMQGIADGSGLSYQQIKDFNMFPELIKAHCSIVGAWSNSTVDHKLLTLRALDWEEDAPLSKNPTVIIYHSTEEGSFPFANIGYAGFIGAITAVGSQGVSVQEKVQLVHDDVPPIPTTYEGKPWAFVMRDLAEFGTTLENMADTLQNTNRTCAIFMGMASAESEAFEGISYTWQDIQFYTDSNYTDYSDSHPELEGIFFVDRRVQPSTNPCIGNILTDKWGDVTWETLFRDIGGLHETGNTQLCAVDVYENEIYISYSADGQSAYLRAPIYVDLKPYFGITGSLQKSKQ